MDHFLSARFKFASLKAKKSKINGSLKVCNAGLTRFQLKNDENQ